MHVHCRSVRKGFGDLDVDEVEEARTRSTSVTSHAEGREHRGVLDPMTPAPTTVIVFGRFLSPRMPSESMIVFPSTAHARAAPPGSAPVAMTIRVGLDFRRAP